jgi:hypothetical protein
MCYGQVDAKTLEREAMDRLRAAQPAARSEAVAEDGPPPELMGGFAGALARLRMAFRQGRAADA